MDLKKVYFYQLVEFVSNQTIKITPAMYCASHGVFLVMDHVPRTFAWMMDDVFLLQMVIILVVQCVSP